MLQRTSSAGASIQAEIQQFLNEAALDTSYQKYQQQHKSHTHRAHKKILRNNQKTAPVQGSSKHNLDKPTLKTSIRTQPNTATPTPTPSPSTSQPSTDNQSVAHTDNNVSRKQSSMNTIKHSSKPVTTSHDVCWYQHSVLIQADELYQQIRAGKHTCVKLSGDEYEKNCVIAESQCTGLFNQLYSSMSDQRTSTTDTRYINTMLKSGTLSDRTAVLTLQIQESPLHRLNELDRLLHMANRKGRREQVMAVDALKQLYQHTLLPPNRSLYTVKQQPLLQYIHVNSKNHKHISTELLCYWMYEQSLKQRYTQFLATIELSLQDPLPYVKKNRLQALYDLLCDCPEQESTVLSLLVNKLGDPHRTVSSKVLYLLTQLLYKHPAMKQPIITEIERLLFRTHITYKSQYYALIYMNQIMFEPDDHSLATHCIQIYFTLFQANVKQITTDKSHDKQRQSVSSKLLSALLTGVNRALPYARTQLQSQANIFQTHLNDLFRVIHGTSISVSMQALMLLYQFISYDNILIDNELSQRYYRVLYNMLYNHQLYHTASKHALWLNLLYKSIKLDNNTHRICAFTRRLLQQVLQYSPSFTAATLYMIAQLCTLPSHQYICRMFDMLEPTQDTEEEIYTDADTTVSANAAISNQYDPHKRDPMYSHASNSCSWELPVLLSQYHPSVQAFAQQLLKQNHISYDGDPLTDFTAITFLDKFVYKKPKSISKLNATRRTVRPHQRGRLYSDMDDGTILHDIEELKSHESIDTVSADNQFFYKYFTDKQVLDLNNTQLQAELQRRRELSGVDIDTYADQVMQQAIDADAHVSDVDYSDTELNEIMSDLTSDDSDLGSDYSIEQTDTNMDDVQNTEFDGISSDTDESIDFSNTDSDTDIDSSVDTNIADASTGQDKQYQRSLYASADDYAQILSNDTPTVNKHLQQWQHRSSNTHTNKQKRRKRS